MIEEVTVGCPYCGEAITLLVDCSAGNQSYTEDCSVCCNPMTVTVHINDQGKLAGTEVDREGG